MQVACKLVLREIAVIACFFREEAMKGRRWSNSVMNAREKTARIKLKKKRDYNSDRNEMESVEIYLRMGGGPDDKDNLEKCTEEQKNWKIFDQIGDSQKAMNKRRMRC